MAGMRISIGGWRPFIENKTLVSLVADNFSGISFSRQNQVSFLRDNLTQRLSLMIQTYCHLPAMMSWKDSSKIPFLILFYPRNT